MEILIVAPIFFPAKDVGIFRMTTLADYLIKMGEKVIVLHSNNFSIFEEPIPYIHLKKVQEIQVKDNNHFFESCKYYKKAILEICNRKNIKLIIYTCAPYYAMKISSEIKKITNIPYILDIRDFWLKDDEESFLTRIIQKGLYPIKMFFQYRCFDNAFYIVVVSNWMKKRYMKLYKKYNNKFRIIYNGYDDQRTYSENLEKNNIIKKIQNFDGIKIGFSGVLCQYSEYYASLMFKALDKINKSCYKIKIFHMGKIEKNIEKILKNKKIDCEIYEYLGYLPNECCISILKEMDINIVINFRSQGLGTKIFDYIYVQKPILYIGKKNTELSYFLKENICDNLESIISTILNIYIYKKTHLDYNKKIHTRSEQNKVYYSLICKLLKEKSEK